MVDLRLVFLGLFKNIVLTIRLNPIYLVGRAVLLMDKLCQRRLCRGKGAGHCLKYLLYGSRFHLKTFFLWGMGAKKPPVIMTGGYEIDYSSTAGASSSAAVSSARMERLIRLFSASMSMILASTS